MSHLKLQSSDFKCNLIKTRPNAPRTEHFVLHHIYIIIILDYPTKYLSYYSYMHHVHVPLTCFENKSDQPQVKASWKESHSWTTLQSLGKTLKKKRHHVCVHFSVRRSTVYSVIAAMKGSQVMKASGLNSGTCMCVFWGGGMSWVHDPLKLLELLSTPWLVKSHWSVSKLEFCRLLCSIWIHIS